MDDIVAQIARETDRPKWPLLLQAKMQLPQLADSRGIVHLQSAKELLLEIANELPKTNEWSVDAPIHSPTDLIFSDHVFQRDADRIMLFFHYLRSPRIDGQPYTLLSRDGIIVALCYVSPLDVTGLIGSIHSLGRSVDQVKVVSRVFAFEGAPRNSISYLLGRVANAQRNLGVTDMLTYVNPNLGFSGASYLAAGWSVFLEDSGLKYRYLDRRYITDRELARGYGLRANAGYELLLGPRFTESKMPLLPLLLFRKQLAAIRPSTKQREAFPNPDTVRSAK